jgi:hypothetical protein
VAQARQQATNVPVGDAAASKFVGPTNVGGRVNDIAVDPTTTPTTLYAAVTSGGIMKAPTARSCEARCARCTASTARSRKPTTAKPPGVS